MLRALLLAATPMMTVPLNVSLATAEAPANRSPLVLPPSPLQTKGLQPNPFCQPSPLQTANATPSHATLGSVLETPTPIRNNFFDFSLSGIRLTSGSETFVPIIGLADSSQSETSVRLLPLEDSTSEAQQAAAGLVRPNPMVIREPQPLAEQSEALQPVAVADESGTKHDKNVTAIPPAVKAPAVAFAPRVIPLIPTVEPTATTAPSLAIASQAAASEVAQAGVTGPLDESPIDTPTTTSTNNKKARPWVPPTEATLPSVSNAGEAAGPVSFSLDDTTLVENAVVAPKATQKVVAVPASRPATRPAAGSTSTAKIARGSAKAILVPLEPADDPRVMSPNASPDKRIVKGSRPRVDVGVPPVAIERTSHAPGPSALGPIAKDASQVKSQEEAFQTDAPVLINLRSTEVRALKFETNIRKVQIEDSSVCAAVAAGPAQIQLIGARSGETRLAIWTTTENGQEQKAVYKVLVDVTSRNTASEAVTIANTLTRSAGAAFPTSKIQVRHEHGEMIVEGVCPDNESARQAMRMIRSACKLPVKDKLTIR